MGWTDQKIYLHEPYCIDLYRLDPKILRPLYEEGKGFEEWCHNCKYGLYHELGGHCHHLYREKK